MTDDMTRRWRKAAIFGLLVVGTFGVVAVLASNACPVPDNMLTDEQLKLILQKDPAHGLTRPWCLEFWFNRYQTLFGAILALIAAWIATIPARGQLREMSRQSAASSRQGLLDLAISLEEEGELIRDISAACSETSQLIYDFEIPRNSFQSKKWMEEWTRIEQNIDNLMSRYWKIHNRKAMGSEDSGGGEGLKSFVQDLCKEMNEVNRYFRRENVETNYRRDDNEVPENVEGAFYRARVHLEDIRRQSCILRDVSFTSASEAWENMRDIETKALGK